MIVRWISDRLKKWSRPARRPRSEYRPLSLLVLEGRSVPSVTPFAPPSDFDAIPVYRADETTLDGLIRLTPWSPAGTDCGRDVKVQDDAPSESAGPMTVAAFMSMFMGTAAVFPYDLEADAKATAVFHGVKV